MANIEQIDINGPTRLAEQAEVWAIPEDGTYEMVTVLPDGSYICSCGTPMLCRHMSRARDARGARRRPVPGQLRVIDGGRRGRPGGRRGRQKEERDG